MALLATPNAEERFNMIRDHNIEYLEKRIYIPGSEFQTVVITPPSGGATDTGGSVGADTGAPVTQEIGTSGIVGWQVGAAGDMFAHFFMVPYDLDSQRQIRFRVWWTQSSTTATDSITWIVTYTAITAETTALVTPVTALDTAITALDLSSGVANVVQATDYGIIAAQTLGDSVDALALRVEADAIGTFSANEPSFLGLEITYTPRMTAGNRALRTGRRLSTSLGTTLGTQVD